jgi:hypothetical protein
MRWNEINEAPLADFGVSGEMDQEGGFRSGDMKAAQSPKWVEKAHNLFAKTPYDFNVYIHNSTDGINTIDGKIQDVRSYVDVRKYHGLTPMAALSKIVGFTPPNADKSISVLLLQNEGDERIGLTPWIMAHRVAHAIMYADRSPTHMRDEQITRCLRDLDQDFQIFFDGSVRRMGITDFDMKEWAKQIGKFASARNGTVRDGGEFKVECFTQYLVQGSVTFNRPENKSSPRTPAEAPDAMLASARAYYNEHQWRKEGIDWAKSITRLVNKPYSGYTAFDKDGVGMASFSDESRIQQYEDRGYTVKHHAVTPAQNTKYLNYQKKLKELELLYDQYWADGKLKPRSSSQTDQLDALVAKAEDNLNFIIEKILNLCVGKALVL